MSESISEILERMTAGDPEPVETAVTETPAPQQPDAANDAEQAADDLRRQVQQATQRADEAHQRMQAEANRRVAAEREVVEARQRVEATSQAAVINALEAAKSEASRMRGELRAAFEAGDYSKVADIQFDIGRIGARVEQLESGAQSFEQQRTQQLRQEPQRPAAPSDPIEADLANRTPRTREWLQKNRNFYTDNKFNAKVVAAHASAIANDIAPDTDAYFDYVERAIGLKQDAPQPAPRATSSPALAAPSSRSTQSMSGATRSGDLIITAKDRAAAAMCGIDAEEYAKERVRLEQAGELNGGRRR